MDLVILFYFVFEKNLIGECFNSDDTSKYLQSIEQFFQKFSINNIFICLMNLKNTIFPYVYNQFDKEKMNNQLKCLKWTPEEQRTLRQLKEAQMDKSVVDWKEIAKILSQKFSVVRSSKQCRQKYVNHARIQTLENNLDWSEEELQALIDLYEEHGASWALFSTKIPNRSENSLKNKFNNGLRKISKTLYKKQGDLYKHTKKSITSEMLSAMIDFVNQIQKSILQNEYTINRESKFFSFRTQILRFSLFNYEATDDELQSLIRKIKALNCKIRCFGIFKVKNRKNWKLSKRSLYTLCQYDKVINEEMFITQERQSGLKQKENERKTEVFSPVSFDSEQINPFILAELELGDFIKPQGYFERDRLDQQVKKIFGQESEIDEKEQYLFY